MQAQNNDSNEWKEGLTHWIICCLLLSGHQNHVCYLAALANKSSKWKVRHQAEQPRRCLFGHSAKVIITSSPCVISFVSAAFPHVRCGGTGGSRDELVEQQGHECFYCHRLVLMLLQSCYLRWETSVMDGWIDGKVFLYQEQWGEEWGVFKVNLQWQLLSCFWVFPPYRAHFSRSPSDVSLCPTWRQSVEDPHRWTRSEMIPVDKRREVAVNRGGAVNQRLLCQTNLLLITPSTSLFSCKP